MITKYLEIITTFLSEDFGKVDKEIIISKSQKLGVEFPDPMIEFYEFFGNNKEVLNAYYIFESIEDIYIQYDGLIFGNTHERIRLLGIQLDQLHKNDPGINRFSKEYNEWYVECIFSSNFFTNIACWQVLNTMPSIAKTIIDQDDLLSQITDKLKPISEERSIYKGNDLFSFYNIELGILACYIKADGELYIAAKEDDIIDDFESDMCWELDWL